MKYFLYIFFTLIIFICISCDKDEISSVQSNSFVKYYGGDLLDEGIRVISLEESGYLLVGTMETADSGKQICVIRTDEFGNSTGNIHLYGNKFNDYVSTIKKNNIGGYIIGGSSEETSKGGKRDILLIQISENGNLEWLDTIHATSNEIANDLLVTDNNDIVITGYRDNPITQNKEFLLIRADQNGNLTEPTSSTLINIIGMSIAKSGNPNDFMIAGYQIKKDLDATTNVVSVLKGSPGSQPTYYVNTHETDNAIATCIIPAENNFYYVLCNVTDESKRKIKIKKMEDKTAGIEPVWEKYYGENDQAFINQGFYHNNKIYLLGTSGSATDEVIENTYGSILFLEMNNDGSSPVYHYIGDGASFHGNGFNFTPDQGVIITGKNKISENSIITLIKLNSSYAL